MTLREEVEAFDGKLKEALSTIDTQTKEIKMLLNENNASKDKIAELQKLNEMLEDKMKSEPSNFYFLH